MRTCLIAFVVLLLGADIAYAETALPALRHPVAALRAGDGRIVIANQRSGSLSVVDRSGSKVAFEAVVGKQLSDVALVGGNELLATDRHAREVLRVLLDDDELKVTARLKLDCDPVAVVVAADKRTAYVASCWGRRIDVVALQQHGALAASGQIPLPFPAGKMLAMPESPHLVIADAFEGRLAVLDVCRRQVTHVHDLGGHNLGGLCWDITHDRLLISHQILAYNLPLTFDNVQWGAVLKNVVRIVPRPMLVNSSIKLATATRVVSLGEEGDGSGDPTGVLPLADGAFAVALGGADELAMVESTGLVTKRVALGRRPLVVLNGSHAEELLVLNHFDDSISKVNLGQDEAAPAVLALGTQPKLSPADRGERLFYDARLSLDRWMSCHSCHSQGHTNGQLADTLGDGNYGAPKRTLTLLGTRDTDRWAWNGEVKELHDQVRKSVESSMHGAASADDVYDLTAYLHTLAPPPPRIAAPQTKEDAALLERGREVFAQQKCTSCHIPPLTYTSHDVYDVGLADENKHTKFNPPSLRGVGQASRLFHDGRATSLEEVFDVFAHPTESQMTKDDRAALLRFLRSL